MNTIKYYLRGGVFLLSFLSGPWVLDNVSAEDSKLEAIELELEELRRQAAKQQEKIQSLEKAVSDSRTVPQVTESASPAPARESSDIWSKSVGNTQLRLIDVSLDALIGAGWSTEDDETLDQLQGGGHDPNRRGFTVQNIELSLTGAIDPYLTGETHLIYFIDKDGESQFELEEAFLTTQTLPAGLQLEVGQSFTEYGIINPTHPHTWAWQDQPLINTRLFGPDGMRGAGFRLGWLTSLPWYSEVHLSAQNATGETMTSFRGENGVGGRPTVERTTDSLNDLVYLARLENSWDLSDTVTTKIGFSGIYGPNNSGTDSDTWIYGSDLKLTWRPLNSHKGWPFVSWQSEYSQRTFDAAPFSGAVETEEGTEEVSYSGDSLKDSGFYTQLLWGFYPGWAAGTRLEYVTGSGDSIGGRENDPLRSDRYRLSPLLSWHPSEFSRIRLQYNYDDADILSDGTAHSVWLGFEWLYGAHPAHKY